MEFIKLVGPFGVFFIMFALGLNLNFRRFIRIFSRPKNFIVGIFCQVIILPFIGLVVISYLPMIKEFQIGVFLLLIKVLSFHRSLEISVKPTEYVQKIFNLKHSAILSSDIKKANYLKFEI